MGTQGLKYIVGSFVLRKEVGDEDDMSVSDMDCSEDEANKPAIEVNVKIPPSMQPRQLKNSLPRMAGPRRISPGRFGPANPPEPPINNNMSR